MKIQANEHKIFHKFQTKQDCSSERMTSCAKTSRPIGQRLQQSCWDQLLQGRLHTLIQDQLWTGMDRNKVGKWVWSPASPQHSGRVSSSALMHCEEEEEEPEEEAGGGPNVCCYTSGKFGSFVNV